MNPRNKQRIMVQAKSKINSPSRLPALPTGNKLNRNNKTLNKSSSDHFATADLDAASQRTNIRHASSKNIINEPVKKSSSFRASPNRFSRSHSSFQSESAKVKLQSCLKFIQSLIKSGETELSPSSISNANIEELCSILSSIIDEYKATINEIYDTEAIKLPLDVV